MKIVGEKLSDWAVAQTEESHVDLFGRSAFNRYYYSAFLITRELLRSLDPKWGTAAHANIPDILRDSLKKRIKQKLTSAKKNKLVTESQASQIQTQANSAILELASLLESSYSIRVTADYEPETKVEAKSRHLSLDNTTLDAAHRWPDRAAMYCKTIYKACQEVGLD